MSYARVTKPAGPHPLDGAQHRAPHLEDLAAFTIHRPELSDRGTDAWTNAGLARRGDPLTNAADTFVIENNATALDAFCSGALQGAPRIWPQGVVIKIDDYSTSVRAVGPHIVSSFFSEIKPSFDSFPAGQISLLEARLAHSLQLVHNRGFVDIREAHQPTRDEFFRPSREHPGGLLQAGSALSDGLRFELGVANRLRERGFTDPIACLLTTDGWNRISSDPEVQERWAEASEALARKAIVDARARGVAFKLF